MKQRNPFLVFLFSFITLGIYAIYWHVSTKIELNKLGANIPTAWLIIIPFANLYWIWKYSEGVEKVSQGKISAVLALILLLLLSVVGYAILQSEFNKLSLEPAAAPGATPQTGFAQTPPPLQGNQNPGTTPPVPGPQDPSQPPTI